MGYVSKYFREGGQCHKVSLSASCGVAVKEEV